MCTRRHFAEEVQQVLVQERILGKERAEVPELFLRGELSVNQEPCGLGEGGLLGKVLDGVASVAEDALFAVNKRNGALGAARVQVAVIQPVFR